MMIGPAPMMRMLSRSVLFGMGLPFSRFLSGGAAVTGIRLDALDHQIQEMLEQQSHVVGAGARLRMPLEAESRPVGARDALIGAVEQGAMCLAQRCGQRARIHREAVILA